MVPEYHEQETHIAEALRRADPGTGRGPYRILELGAGTGTLSRRLLREFPEAELTTLDVSPVMVEECADVLASFGSRARVLEADFATAELGSGYQAVASRLAIHHLREEEKQALYRRVHEALLPGGVFINSDLISGETDAETGSTLAEWRAHMLVGRGNPDEWEPWLVGDDDYPTTERSQAAGLLEA